jgi:Trypsin-like peptidase domain
MDEFLAEKRPNPIPFRGIDLKLNSDIAICKVPSRTDGRAHQPLAIVQSGIKGTSLVVGATVGAIGYPAMSDVELIQEADGSVIFEGKFEPYASVGKILERFPDNSALKTASTPGPCFSFDARIPGGMSGGAIFDR